VIKLKKRCEAILKDGQTVEMVGFVKPDRLVCWKLQDRMFSTEQCCFATTVYDVKNASKVLQEFGLWRFMSDKSKKKVLAQEKQEEERKLINWMIGCLPNQGLLHIVDDEWAEIGVGDHVRKVRFEDIYRRLGPIFIHHDATVSKIDA